jgi:hypothetical protein
MMLWLVNILVIKFACQTGGAVSLPVSLAKWVGCQKSLCLWWVVYDKPSPNYYQKTNVIFV